MTQFRPCIDLHDGEVKQIVGGTLSELGVDTNFVSENDAAFYASLYRRHQLLGGHVIALGPGNEAEVMSALQTWPQGLQFGGGVNETNVEKYLKAGADKVIVTSYLFEEGEFSWPRLKRMLAAAGRDKLVLDLSCRRVGDGWNIATNRWQTVTNAEVNAELLERLSEYCSEFLVHAADVEGLQNGIDEALVSQLAEYAKVPVTYAGGASSLKDLQRVHELSGGKVDLTIGSALDIFGGTGVSLQQCVAWNRMHSI